MTTHTAPKTPPTRNAHHKDASENRVTFTVSLSAPNALMDRRVIALTQIGTTATYLLTEERHQRSASFQSSEAMMAIPQQITGKNAAWTAYKARRTRALSEPHAYVLGEVIETRPTGITDPKDRRYVAANLRTLGGKGGQAGNCYYVWTSTVGRADDAPLTADDIAALKAYPRGQVHVVTGNPGDMTATVHSEVDSSD